MEENYLELKKLDSFERTLIFEDEDGNRLDITDWIVYFIAKTNINDPDETYIIYKKITSHSSTLGETTLALSSTETKVAVGNYPFAIKVLTDNTVGGVKEALTILEGVLVITDTIIQAVS